jgi:hypothetical protein
VTAWVRVLYRTLTRGGHFLGYPLCWPRCFYSRRLFACPPRQGESQPCRRLQHTQMSDSLAADGHQECDAATPPACRAFASAPCWAAETPAHERLPWPMPHALGVRARASLMEGTLAAFGGSKLVKQPSGQRAGGAMIGAQRVLAARRRPLTAGSVAANTALQRIVRHRSPCCARRVVSAAEPGGMAARGGEFATTGTAHRTAARRCETIGALLALAILGPALRSRCAR